MKRAIWLAAALVVVLATGVWAQDMTGTVERIDGNTIFFRDGTIVHLKEGSRIFVNGREVALATVRPGMGIVVSTAPATAAPVVAQPGVTVTTPGVTVNPPGVVTPGVTVTPPAASVTPPAGPVLLQQHPPVDISGVVARYDAANRIIVFQDGRSVRLTDQSVLWQTAPGSGTVIQPGMRIFVRNGQPVAYSVPAPAVSSSVSSTTVTVPPPPAAVTVAPGQNYMLGTVARVDQAGSIITLRDGTTVRVNPGTTLQSGDRQVTIAQVRPGDEVVVYVNSPGTAATDTIGGAMPRWGMYGASVDATAIHIMRNSEAP